MFISIKFCSFFSILFSAYLLEIVLDKGYFNVRDVFVVIYFVYISVTVVDEANPLVSDRCVYTQISCCREIGG